MTRSIDVFIGEPARPCGLLRFDQRGHRERASFEYGAGWLADVDRFMIDPSLRLVAGAQFRPASAGASVFHAAIADTDPDGWARNVILRDHAKRRAAGEHLPSPLNSLDFLLAVDDEARLGALRFRDERKRFQRAEPRGRRTPPLVELADLLRASQAVETNTETAHDLAYLRGRGTSLGGLRPKCTIVDDDGMLAIGKFPSVQDSRAVTKGEVLALRLARMAGIDAAEARLVDADGTHVAVIRRFDRVAGGRRVMYVSAATMLEANSRDEHAYTEIVDALRRNGLEARADIEELWRRIAFSILITNVDDHLLNHGFLHAHHELWRLAPAFDLNPFPDRVRELKTWISESAGPRATIDALMSVIAYFAIPLARAKELLAEVVAAVERWRPVGRELGMTDAELEHFAPAFEHDERPSAIRAVRP